MVLDGEDGGGKGHNVLVVFRGEQTVDVVMVGLMEQKIQSFGVLNLMDNNNKMVNL